MPFQDRPTLNIDHDQLGTDAFNNKESVSLDAHPAGSVETGDPLKLLDLTIQGNLGDEARVIGPWADFVVARDIEYIALWIIEDRLGYLEDRRGLPGLRKQFVPLHRLLEWAIGAAHESPTAERLGQHQANLIEALLKRQINGWLRKEKG